MPGAREIISRYRMLGLAVLLSAALHAAVMVGMPQRLDAIDEAAQPVYAARLDLPPAPVLVPATPPAKPIPRPRRAPNPAISLPPDVLAALPVETANDASPEADPGASLAAAPEMLALAQPATPVKTLAAPSFPVNALPGNVTIDYRLTSSFAEGRATYKWERDGDTYRVTGEAEAEGFFTLFLEGRIMQESHGTVSASGLRPERFTERRPNAAEEGVSFDWARGKVTFEKGEERKSGELAGNTVDWLSMIFQLAHVPPSTERYDMQVYTQRRMYRFSLRVLGVEEIDIPLGRVRALHLRHEDPERKETVDVWLGVDQHYVPVKMRYPVARNRLVVDQVATRIEMK
jgi:hypothetical protein